MIRQPNHDDVAPHEEIEAIWNVAKAELLYDAWKRSRDLAEWKRYLEAHPPSAETLAIVMALGREKYESTKARKRANKRHRAAGGSHDMRAEMQKIFASGNYGSNRDACAKAECDRLGIPFHTARKYLRNTPNPT